MYAGEQYDPDLGLYYNRARYLDVNRGRFWSQDSFEGYNEDPASLHKYLYAASNPVNQLDPSGNTYAGSEVATRTQQTGIGARFNAEYAKLSAKIMSQLTQTFGQELVSSVISTAVQVAAAPETLTAPILFLSTGLGVIIKTAEEESKKYEIFYRVMSFDEYLDLLFGRGSLSLLPQNAESFVTQSLYYTLRLSLTRFAKGIGFKYTFLVIFLQEKGTRDALVARGARSNGAEAIDPTLASLPEYNSLPDDYLTRQSYVNVKGERDSITYGLRRGTINIFNSRTKGFFAFKLGGL